MISWLKSIIQRVESRLRLKKQIARQSRHIFEHGVSIAEAQLSLPRTMPGGLAWPKISVITPSFNQGRYIAETIESVLQQDYPNVEHIIIDGGSNDDTMQVVERYRSQLSHVVSEPDRGQSDALNKGFRLATGDILCWLNSDDQFAPGALAAVAMAFATRDVDLLSGICEIYKDGNLIHRHMTSCANGPLPLQDLLDLDNGWNAGQFFYQPEVFFSRALWERAGAHVREDCYYSMDYELWCRFAHVGAELHVIGAPLARFRMHPEQKTADPAKFKKELIEVRDRFAATHSIKLQPSLRPPVRFERALRVAMVNDVGMQYGAGIAHGRLAAGLDMAGHDVKLFLLRFLAGSDGKPDEADLVENVVRFDPDVVVFGNLHAVTRDSVGVVEKLSARFPSFWVTHDFWLFTGRCAYTGECRRYLSGCDASCPTAKHYPDLAPKKISDAWKRKQSLLGGPHSPFILANSVWSEDRAHESLSAIRSDAGSRIRNLQLGAPIHLFKPLKKMAARSALGIKTDHFVIAFSVSSLAESRKGGHYLVEALRDLNLPNLSVILIGNQDVPLEISGAELVPLGYVTETTTLTAALSAADIYVGPSTEETFGQVFIEAALVGTPSIGFDQTGVRDAIVEGVTGLRVSPSTQALREAIVRLYRDRDMCKNLGSWARIYALNEFSLESAYHSLFTTWRHLGLIDQWGAPHKIGFIRPSAFVDESLRPVTSWRAVHGVSAIEGPYPQFDLPTAFQWCHGAQSRVVVHCPEEGRYLIRLTYYSNLFESMEVKLHANGGYLDSIAIKRTKPGISAHAEFQINGLAGANLIDVFPGQAREPTHDEPRALTFMLRDIKLQRIDN
ncbi:MAG: Glycosyltransferase involved in cell wall bisynthesis [Candidatus Nitrotoga sp. LAW]|nr:MAG: Glycosyltransferase involved in cell wall bisynthesis [Candidatus Nitrotoga sp. LAW]